MSQTERSLGSYRGGDRVRQDELAQQYGGPMDSQIVGGKLEMRTFGDLLEYAAFTHNAGMAPASMKTPQAVAICLMSGREAGLTDSQSLSCVMVINNRPALWGDALPALIHSKSDCEYFEEWYEIDGHRLAPADMAREITPNVVAVCRAKRRSNSAEIMRAFSYQQAITAGLHTKNIWKSYPWRMLQMRARALVARDGFADVLGGMGVAEEQQGIGEDEPNFRLQPTGNRVPEAYFQRMELKDTDGAQQIIGGENYVASKDDSGNWMIYRKVPVGSVPPPPSHLKEGRPPAPQPAGRGSPQRGAPTGQSRSQADLSASITAVATAFQNSLKVDVSTLERVIGLPADQWKQPDVLRLRDIYKTLRDDLDKTIDDFIVTDQSSPGNGGNDAGDSGYTDDSMMGQTSVNMLRKDLYALVDGAKDSAAAEKLLKDNGFPSGIDSIASCTDEDLLRTAVMRARGLKKK